MIRSAPPAPFKTALITLLIAIALAILAAGKADARDANWKISIKVDYTSAGTVTDERCYPSAGQEDPSPVTVQTSRTVSWRDVRVTSLQMYEAPNGVPAVIVVGPPYKAKLSETRSPGVSSDGNPVGCFSGDSTQNDCGTKSVRSGAYFSPVGRIHAWKGFDIEAEQRLSFERCGTNPAEVDLRDPYDAIELKASAAKLTGHAPKLVFHKTRTFSAGKDSGSLHASAAGKLTYTVKLVHR
jgi:hypothetical protein